MKDNDSNRQHADLLARREKLLGKNVPLFYDQPLHLVRGKGVHLFDSDGNQYLDVYNNVPNVGHCHPRVVEALSRQAATLNIHTRYLHETILDYVENLTSTFSDPLSMAMFTCTGSEANDLAMRIARHNTGKNGIICTNETYHGNTAAVDELATLFHGSRAIGPNVKSVPFPDSYRPLNGLQDAALCDAYLHYIDQAIAEFEQEGIGFAGILLCPIFANEAVPSAPPGYLKGVAERVRAHNGLLIFDEVQSGFGRAGKMWGHQLTGVQPDIITLGKPMGNGHPIAGVVASPDLVNRFREDVMYFNTFGGNPVSCAVAQAVLDVIHDEALVENAESVGNYLRAGLRELQQRWEVIGDVRGPGLFVAVELVSDRNAKQPASELAARVINKMKQKRVLISKIGPFDNVLKIRPPIIFSKDNVDHLLGTLDTVFTELVAEGHA
ncbi:aminotransferase class III-fold pyridoxal phosphate-dependent enzyme [Flavobacteriaceae bacterium]|nr:aminotransferase class III-fold pyridoxal phosphate-dependent enzyme [Flavobacteriaceae bacterium]